KHGGIAAAVRNIPYGIQQPAVSGQIAKLEESLGTQLFQRRPLRFRRQGLNYSSLSSHFSTTSRSLAKSYVRTGRRNCALLRRRSCSTTTFRSCCRSFGLNFPSSGSICTRRRAPKQRDYC